MNDHKCTAPYMCAHWCCFIQGVCIYNLSFTLVEDEQFTSRHAPEIAIGAFDQSGDRWCARYGCKLIDDLCTINVPTANNSFFGIGFYAQSPRDCRPYPQFTLRINQTANRLVGYRYAV